MNNYFNLFSLEKKEKGNYLYKNNNIIYIFKYNNKFFSKINNSLNNYFILIDNSKFNCSCKDNLCEHIYSSLLGINNNEYKDIDLSNFSKEKLLYMINHLILKDSDFLVNIENYINNQKKIIIPYVVKEFFDDFESDDFDYLINDEYNEYEYQEDLFYNYDEDLINLLKKIKIKDNNLKTFINEKIQNYNYHIDNINLNNIFVKTLKYLENPEEYIDKNDIIKLFSNNYEKAVEEFDNIDDFNEIIYIYNNINHPNKIELLLKKFDNYLKYNSINYSWYNEIKTVIKNMSDEEKIKRYSLILYDYIPSFDLFIKIKPLCNEDEIKILLDKVIKLNHINNDNFNILFHFKLYNEIYNLIKENSYILEYCNELIKYMPDEINSLIKKNIEYILNEKKRSQYEYAIEYLKIFFQNNTNDEFIKYTNNLLDVHKRKNKFKKLFNSNFL
jgi:hypothetical protein